MRVDARLVGAWQVMGYIAFDEHKWEEAARYLDEAVRLEPLNSPLPWYFDAAANYELRRFEIAERSIRTAISLNHQGTSMPADYLLGIILIARHDLSGGAQALRN